MNFLKNTSFLVFVLATWLFVSTCCAAENRSTSSGKVSSNFYVSALGGVGFAALERQVDELGHFWADDVGVTKFYGTGALSFGHRWPKQASALTSSQRSTFHGVDFSILFHAFKDTVYDDTQGVSYPASSTLHHNVAFALAYMGGVSYQTWSFYGKAGLSLGLFKHKTDFSSPQAAAAGYEAYHTVNSWTIGPTITLGAEYAISRAWRLNMQYASTLYPGIETRYRPASNSEFNQNTGPMYTGQLMVGVTYLF